MSNVDSTKPSYVALNTVSSTVRAFVEYVDLIPEEDEGRALLRILSDKLESDLSMLTREIYSLWKFVPDTEKPD